MRPTFGQTGTEADPADSIVRYTARRFRTWRSRELSLPRLLTREERASLKQQPGRVEATYANSSGSVDVVWGWYDRRRGVVVWAFKNSSSSERQVMLFRNSYYFGDGYWSVYYNNASFHTPFLDGSGRAPPLTQNSLQGNSPPLALVQFDSFPQSIVCFVFTLSAGQTWAMLEGGYGPSMEPSGVSLHDLSPLVSGEFCAAYDAQAVKDWDEQTRSTLGGYSPNPSTFNTWLFQAESNATFRRVFGGDSFVNGRCAQFPAANTEGSEKRPAYEGGLFPAVFPGTLSPPLNP
jgi:hypothetical protein